MTGGKIEEWLLDTDGHADVNLRILAVMPHLERSTLFAGWVPDSGAAEWGQVQPGQWLFYSARRWVSI